MPQRYSVRRKMPDNRFYSVQDVSPGSASKIILIIFALIITGVLSVYFSPSEFLFQVLGIPSINGCPLLTFTGIPCPFCGMGRVFSCMLDLYIARSFYYNPLGLFFYILSGSAIMYVLILAFKKKRIELKRPANKLLWVCLGFLVLMWVLNILYGHHHH